MPILNKDHLKSLFKNGTIPTERDFHDLIDSVLVKRDDHFFGTWESGRQYCLGDVVLYKKSLYILAQDEENAEVEPEKAGVFEFNPKERKASNDCICSTVTPDCDPINWSLIELKIEDDDWKIIRKTDEQPHDIMYAGVFGRIGMGTDESNLPEARLDIVVKNKGQFLFDPDESSEPHFIIRNLNTALEYPNFLESRVGATASWLTNTPLGYAFKIPAAEEAVRALPTSDDEYTLMLIASNRSETGAIVPCVGIGTEQPEAALDISDQSRIQLKTDKAAGPELILYKLDPQGNRNYLAFTLGEEVAVLTTDAPNGIRFKKGALYSEFVEEGNINVGTTLVSIDGNGNLGIGVEEPKTKLHVTDNESGDVRISLNQINPSFSIINIRPNTVNYLTLGADNDQSLFLTDSKDGFVFRKGNPGTKGKEDLAERLDQGDDLLRILPTGKVGIGVRPSEYDLEVNGLVQANTFYQIADRRKTKDWSPLEVNKLLETLKSIHAYKHSWDERTTNCADNGTQIGFKVVEVEEAFPEIVKTTAGQKSIAYQNLVPVLVEAINLLNDKIGRLEARLKGSRD